MSGFLDLPRKLEPVVQAIIHRSVRYVILYGGRGSAKSWSVARILLNVGRHLPIRVLCAREIQKSIEESVYQLLVDQISDMGLGAFYNCTKSSIVGQNGSLFIFAGLRQQDITKLKSMEGVDIVWVEEGQVVTDKSWEVLIPTIRKEASMIIVTFNPELDTDPTYVRFVEKTPPRSLVLKLNHSDNPFFPQVLEEERAYLEETDKSPGKVKYLNIWEGECMPAVEGAIFAAEVARLFEDGRVRPLNYDPKGKVHMIMDLGWGVMACILVQRFASTVQIIGYREYSGVTYETMTRDLETLPYRWGKVFMPHDASHRDPKYGKSHFEVMEGLGWTTAKIDQIGIENYVSAGREMFGNLYISDSEECARLIHCLRRWKRQIPTTTDHPGAPMKDEFSHGSEAFCYVAVVADQIVNDISAPKDPYSAFRTRGM